MAEITPRMGFPYPSDREQPFFTVYKAGELARDAAHWAYSENHNIVFAGGGTWGWTAGTSTLSWTDPILVLGFTSKNFMSIPAQSITVEDGEVVFFNVLRLLQTSPSIALEKGPIISKPGVRLHDLMLFAARIGDTIYLGGGKSLVDGDAGIVYGGGLPAGGGGGITLLTAGDGIDITNPGGPNATIATRWAGLGGPFGTGIEPARHDHSHVGLGHEHENQLVVTTPFTFPIDLDGDAAITAKTLLRAHLYRNGQRLTEGGLNDFTVNLPAKTMALNFAPNPLDILLVDRETI